MIEKRYSLIILNSLKMIFAGISSICVASLFNLDFAVSAGIVAMLSIMPSKKETFHTAFSRFAGFLTALFISFLCFKIFGITLIAYFIYLAVNSNASLSQNQNSDISSQKNIKYKNKIASKKTNKSGQDGSLPVWIYIISVLVLIILIICLYSCL